jgi:hypothetical protein
MNPLTSRSRDARSPVDFDYERSKTECTFMPTLKNKTKSLLERKSYYYG